MLKEQMIGFGIEMLCKNL